MQHHPVRLDYSEFGKGKSFFDMSNALHNQNLAQQFISKIEPRFKSIIDSMAFSSSIKLNIETKILGKYAQLACNQNGELILREFFATGIAIEFGTFLSKSNNRYNCISIVYISDALISLPINIRTLMPGFEVLIFIDFESVVFAINKILREIFYQPMIDRIVAQRTPVVLYHEAIIRGRKKNINSVLLVLGSKGRKDFIRHIASFLADFDAKNCV
jgi:hypothetical protein